MPREFYRRVGTEPNLHPAGNFRHSTAFIVGFGGGHWTDDRASIVETVSKVFYLERRRSFFGGVGGQSSSAFFEMINLVESGLKTSEARRRLGLPH